MGNVVQQSEAPGLHVSPFSTLEAKIVHQSEAPDYMINDTHSKLMINLLHIVRLYIEMFATQKRFLMYMMPHTVHLMAKVVHQGILGKGT